jgi:hypothetical protein
MEKIEVLVVDVFGGGRIRFIHRPAGCLKKGQCKAGLKMGRNDLPTECLSST